MLSTFSVNFLYRAAPSCVRNSTTASSARLTPSLTATHSSSESSSASVFAMTSGRRSSVPIQSCGSGSPALADISLIWRQ